MSNEPIEVPYNFDLPALEQVLARINRPGDFFAQGTLELPLPRIEVDGVGLLSFPVPAGQARQLIEQAERAPYGRGAATVVDTAVRKVWQIQADKTRVAGKSWAASLRQILDQVAAGLGCDPPTIDAELYKLLVYDQGSFFLPHRDTEKTAGMFGTLIIVLPGPHRGGELVIRHAGREATVDLSSAEVSEFGFAAFYADCEHEVKPVTEGHRVCLVYNLLQRPSAGAPSLPLTAPRSETEIAAAAELLGTTFAAANAPLKIAWLLEHQYSPAGLSFAALKNADAALGKALGEAAARADCVAHLGIVHIEESGPAEPSYEDYGWDARRRRSRSRYAAFDEPEDDKGEEVGSDDFEVIEVCDSDWSIDNWIGLDNRPRAFGTTPLEAGELLPAGALDDEEPDAQRLTEATGNAGASFERAYHRAALVVWPRERTASVLLRASVSAATPCLREQLTAGDHAAAARIAREIIDAWENPPTPWAYRSLEVDPSRAEMIEALDQLGDQALLRRFINGPVMTDYNGSENEALAASLPRLGAKAAAQLLAALARESFPLFPGPCVELLHRVVRERGEDLGGPWRTELSRVAAVVVAALPQLAPPAPARGAVDWRRVQQSKGVDAGLAAELLDCLRRLGDAGLRAQAATAMRTEVGVFDPVTVITPALTLVHKRERQGFAADVEARQLWTHAAEFLLARSEQPPAPPTDWRQTTSLACRCEDCRALQAFVDDPHEQTHRFRVRQDRRQHLHQQIQARQLDMTHVTERKGSPQTLVCVKTRGAYERQCRQHQSDVAAMASLLALRAVGDAALIQRLTAALARRSPA